MKVKILLLVAILIVSYTVYEIYLYQKNDCNLILMVNNQSLENPIVRIEILISGKVVVNENFKQINPHYLKSFHINTKFGYKRITVKVNGEIQKDEQFWLLGVKWITVHNNGCYCIDISYYNFEPMFL